MSDASPEYDPRAPATPASMPPTQAPSLLDSDAELQRRRSGEFARVLVMLTPHVYVTPVLVAANVMVYVLGFATGVSPTAPSVPDLLKWGADFGPSVLEGEWWRIVTCLFVHLGLFHLVMNMFILATAGPLVERLVGNVGFLVLYLVAGLCGSLTSLCYHPLVVSAGASGAIFGVYGALIAIMRQKTAIVPQEVLNRIRKGGLLFVGYNLLFGLVASNIDNAAHIGGLVGGFLCGLVMNLPLAPDSVSKRPGRNVLAAIVGMVLVTASVVIMSSLYGDLPAVGVEDDRFVEMEKRVLDVSNGAAELARHGELSDDNFAERIERDVLPEWRASAARYARLQNLPADAREHVDKMIRCMHLRQEAWEMEVKALRAHDDAMMHRANDLHAQAEEAAKQLSQSAK
jgi:rhomboid protease GluP